MTDDSDNRTPKDSPGKIGDFATILSRRRTNLALQRNFLASERTLMGWVRTSLSMITFGFTIGKLSQILVSVEIKGFLGRTHLMSVRSIAYFFVILGTLALFGASLQHWQRMRELQSMGLHRQLSITFFVALILTALGCFALIALALSL
jgi:putative membrane protein